MQQKSKTEVSDLQILPLTKGKGTEKTTIQPALILKLDTSLDPEKRRESHTNN